MSVNISKGTLWLGLALLVSIGLNLFLVGYMIGKDPQLRPGAAMGPPHSQLRRFLRTLSEQRRAELAPLAREYWRASRSSMKPLLARRAELNTLLRAPALNEAEVLKAMAAVDDALRESSQQSQRAMLPFINALTTAEREQLAEQRPPMHPHRPRQSRYGKPQGGVPPPQTGAPP